MSEQNPQEWVSKTRMKKQMNDLQDLGVQLTRLSADTLKKIGLPEDLLEALLAHKKITANGALKRQTQYIGRLMRDIDPAPIEAYLAKLRGDNPDEEKWEFLGMDTAFATLLISCLVMVMMALVMFRMERHLRGIGAQSGQKS